MDKAVESLRAGLGWGIAVALAHLIHGIGLIMVLGQPPLTLFALKGSLIEVALGLLAGILLVPLRWVPKANIAQPIAFLVVWLVMERLVAVDPSKPLMWIGPPLGGLLLYGIGSALAKKHIGAVAGASALAFGVLLAAPEVRSAITDAGDLELDLKPAREGAPDVLFIVMDTTRAQSSSAYGYGRDTTPTLEALAKEGVLYEQATAPATWSLPAHAALFTGTFPSFNQAHAETRYLGDTLPTVMEVFAANGYETSCFSANPHISESFGLTRGFHHSDRAWAAGPAARQFSFIYRFLDFAGVGANDKGGAMVVGNIRRWMKGRPKDGPPAFVFVNFLEAHFPFHQLPNEFVTAYQNRPISELREAGQIAFGAQFGRPLTQAEIEQIRAPLVDLYDGGVKYTDHLVGEVVDEWRKAGRLDNTIVVVLGDHGEVMGEHDAFGHVVPMVEQDLRVPLVFRYPAKLPKGKRVAKPVSTVGTFATLADLAGLEKSTVPRLQVGSLTKDFDAEKLGEPVMAERYEEHLLSARFAEGQTLGVGPLMDPRGRYRSFRWHDWKYVERCDHGEEKFYLYNLADDPGETKDLMPERPSVVDDIEPELLAVKELFKLPGVCDEVTGEVKKLEDMSKEEVAQLCQLGYLSGEECEGL